MDGDIKMKEGMEKIFKGFDIGKARKRFQATGIENSRQLMSFNTFVNKMVHQGCYGHGNIVFLEKMIEQIKVFGDYFSNTAEDKDILFIYIDIDTLWVYSNWLQKLIWHLDGLRIILKKKNLVRKISGIQKRISYFMADILLYIGSINVDLLGDAISSYFSAIEQISIFHKGTLEDLEAVLRQAKHIID